MISFVILTSLCYFPQASLDSEKRRANDAEGKYNELQESSEVRRKTLEEKEKKVQQLQETLRG